MGYSRWEKLFGALANPTRLEIVDLVSRHKEMCVCELVEELGQSQANISRHVSILRDAGVLADRKVGVMVVVRVNEVEIAELFSCLQERIDANHKQSAAVDVEARLEARCPTCS
jgi:ArsR family transcriptional regulator